MKIIKINEIHEMQKKTKNKTKPKQKYPPAPPCEGQPAAGKFVQFAFLMTVYSLLPTVCFLECTANCFTVVRGTQNAPNYPPLSSGFKFWTTPGRPWKIIKFQGCLQGTKNHAKCFSGHPKSCKINPQILTFPVSAKSCFCNTFHTKTLFWEPQVPGFRSRNRCRERHGTEPRNNTKFLAIGARKALRMGSQIMPKSTEMRPWIPTCPPCCSQCRPGCPQDGKIAPKAAKIEAPGLPNHSVGHKKNDYFLFRT